MQRNALMAPQTQPLLTQTHFNALWFDLLKDFHPFSHIGFSSESNAFLRTLCHQRHHHSDLYEGPTILTHRCTQEH